MEIPQEEQTKINISMQNVNTIGDTENVRLINSLFKYKLIVPRQIIPHFDNIICNKTYETPKKFEGIKCKNFRGIDIDGRLYYLNVGTIDLDDQKISEPGNNEYVNFVKNKFRCDQDHPNLKKFIDKGLLQDETTIYFKGAYVSYPSHIKELLEDTKLDKSNILEEYKTQLDIYAKGAKGILINILPYLEKLGIKTLIVDPAPGFHPNTEGRDEKTKIAGLVKLYEGMGLHAINCYFPTSAKDSIDFIDGDENTKIRKIRAFVDKFDMKYDHPLMIGDVAEMLKKMESVNSRVASIISWVSSDVTETRNFLEVPFKFYARTSDENSLITAEKMGEMMRGPDLTHRFRREIPATRQQIYRQKYLKYKQKYLELKKTTE